MAIYRATPVKKIKNKFMHIDQKFFQYLGYKERLWFKLSRIGWLDKISAN